MNPYYHVPGYFRGQPMPHPPSPRTLNRGLQPALQQHFMQQHIARIQHEQQVHRAMATAMAYNRSADLAEQDHIGKLLI